MKVIFLDNDGVICLANNWGSRYKKLSKHTKKHGITYDEAGMNSRPVFVRFDNFDPKAVKILNEVLTKTDAEIVVSSDWREYATLEELGDYYASQGILKKPVAVTPKLKDFDEPTAALCSWKNWSERARIIEIKKYLADHPEVSYWVAIDDLNMSKERHQENGLENFVLTPRSNEGIKQSGVKEKMIKYLTSNPKEYDSH